jgi:hypothetical protein
MKKREGERQKLALLTNKCYRTINAMNGIPNQAEIAVYVNCMEEIKLRTAAVNMFFKVASGNLYRISAVEFVSLQIRKILELIALASLASHKEEFAKQHQKFAEMWRARKILKDLEKLNPGFYPVPTEQVRDPQTGSVLQTRNVSKPFLTKQDFERVYQDCSAALHAQNPFGPQVDILRIESEFPSWMERIQNLLNHHQVQLLNSKHQLWILMQASSDGRVHASLMQKIEDPARVKLLDDERSKRANLSSSAKSIDSEQTK